MLLLATLTSIVNAAKYQAILIGDLPGGEDRSDGFALNDLGQVVGASSAVQGTRAFLWDPVNGMTNLGIFADGGYSRAVDINASGQVTGIVGFGGSGEQRPFLWDAVHGMTEIGTLPLRPGAGHQTVANAINDGGDVVGSGGAGVSSPNVHAFLWNPSGGMKDLGDFPGGLDRSVAFDINNAGLAVGVANLASASGAQDVPFKWTESGGMQDLSAVLGAGARPYRVNQSGAMAGHIVPSTGGVRAFYWDSSLGLKSFSLFGSSSYAYAYGINDLGQVVGDAGAHAFIWDAVGGIHDLNSLVEPLPEGWSLFVANDINNAGQIVAQAMRTLPDDTQLFRTYLLNPIPEPSGLALALVAMVGSLRGKLRQQQDG